MHGTSPPPSSRVTPVYGYASFSARDGANENEELRRQSDAIAAACERRSLELVQIVREREPSNGKSLRRPGLEYALKRLSSGAAGALVVFDLFRLTSSAAELGAILEWFVLGEMRLIALSQEIDTAERDGLLAARTLIEMSDREQERITARTSPGLEVARGHRRPPRRAAVADHQALVHRIKEMHHQGMSLQAIADRLNAEGVPTIRGGAKWRPSSLQSVTGYRRRKPELVSLLSKAESESQGNSAGPRDPGCP